ncbi:hypothetical protein DK853_41755, partial [Klebsiella oxytoca]
MSNQIITPERTISLINVVVKSLISTPCLIIIPLRISNQYNTILTNQISSRSQKLVSFQTLNISGQ